MTHVLTGVHFVLFGFYSGLNSRADILALEGLNRDEVAMSRMRLEIPVQ